VKGHWCWPSPYPLVLNICIMNFILYVSFGKKRRHRKPWKHCTIDYQNEDIEFPFKVGFHIWVSKVNNLSCVMNFLNDRVGLLVLLAMQYATCDWIHGWNEEFYMVFLLVIPIKYSSLLLYKSQQPWISHHPFHSNFWDQWPIRIEFGQVSIMKIPLSLLKQLDTLLGRFPSPTSHMGHT